MGQNDDNSLATFAFQLAIASTILGIFGLVLGAILLIGLGALGAALSLLLGIVATLYVLLAEARFSGRAVIAIGLACLNLFLVWICLNVVKNRLQQIPKSSCTNNEKQWGLVFRMYANDHPGGYWPELSPEPGRLMVAVEPSDSSEAIYPNFMTDIYLTLCPSDNEFRKLRQEFDSTAGDADLYLNDWSYFYLGYVITNEDELETFAGAYRNRIESGEPFSDDLKVAPGKGNLGGDTIYRLREGVERIVITDPRDTLAPERLTQSIPVLIERFGNHVPGGGNILYMDGHVEWRPHGQWPMTDRSIEIVESLDAMGQRSTPPGS